MTHIGILITVVSGILEWEHTQIFYEKFHVFKSHDGNFQMDHITFLYDRKEILDTSVALMVFTHEIEEDSCESHI